MLTNSLGSQGIFIKHVLKRNDVIQGGVSPCIVRMVHKHSPLLFFQPLEQIVSSVTTNDVETTFEFYPNRLLPTMLPQSLQ